MYIDIFYIKKLRFCRVLCIFCFPLTFPAQFCLLAPSPFLASALKTCYGGLALLTC